MKDNNLEMDFVYDWVEDKKSRGENRTNVVNEKKNNINNNNNVVENNNNNIDNKKKERK